MALVVVGVLLFAATGSASAGPPQPQKAAATPTTQPTDPPTPDPLTPDCYELTYANLNKAAQAIVSGQSMQISTTVRNLRYVPDNGFYMKIMVSVYYAKAPFGPAPFVLQWSRDNGAWHSSTLTFFSSAGDPTWATAKISTDPIPYQGSSTFRLKMSFKSNSPRGWYWSYIEFGTDTCDEGVTNSLTFTYNPERIVAHSPRSTAHPSASPSADPTPTPTPPTNTSPSALPPPPAIATPGSDRPKNFRRTFGSGLSGVLLLAALVQAIRWRRRRLAAGS